MGTIADKLELLRRTKERQRAYLEQKYPLLDFDTIPFRAYLDLFQGRSYIPGFVLGVKTYGRSNNEDASTRDILPDYSGNGRDIKLYNFAFSKMSGYNGYTQDFLEFSDSAKISRSSTEIIVNKIDNGVSTTLAASKIPDRRFRCKLKVSGLNQTLPESTSGVLTLQIYDNGTSPVPIKYTEDGIYEVDYTLTEDATSLYFYCYISSFLSVEIQPITIEQLPVYPGALVSDGVDDYGQCIKDFALPDDYTVVAIRKLLNSKGNAGLVGKSRNMGYGAFIFEYASSGSVSYSYGGSTRNSNVPALFSYLTKTSFNGVIATPGTAEDGSKDKLTLFHEAYTSYKNAALYDLRIYDHSLTAEELQTVKDEMMTDYENATGGGYR